MFPNTSSILLFYLLSLWMGSGSGTPFPGRRHPFPFNPVPVYEEPTLRPSAETSQQFPSPSSPSSSSFWSPSHRSAEDASAIPSSFSPLFLDHIIAPPFMYPVSQSLIRSGLGSSLPRITSLTYPEAKRRSAMLEMRTAAKRLANRRVNTPSNMMDANYGGNNKVHTNGTSDQPTAKKDNVINSWQREERSKKQADSSPSNSRPMFLTSPFASPSQNKDPKDRQSVRESRRSRSEEQEEDHPSSSMVADPSLHLATRTRGQQKRISLSEAGNTGSTLHSSSSPSPPAGLLTTSDPSPISSLESSAYQFMDLIPVRRTRESRLYDVPQVECPPSDDEVDNFACPSPDSQGRYRCIGSHALCDGFRDCPKGEDEDRKSCLFYKSTKAHLDVLADALLRWARQRY